MKGLAVVSSAPKVGQLGNLLEFREDIPSPKPEENHVVVRVLAAGIAIDEIHGAEGSFLGYFRFGPKTVSKRAPLVPGVECCGVIEQLGPGVKGFKVGDVVLGSVKVMSSAQGTWAERVMLPVGPKFALKPAHLSPEEALSTFLAGDVVVTALEIARPILEKAKRPPTIVVAGATGSIGTLMLQAIRHMQPDGTKVIAICSSRNAGLAEQFGATRVMAYDTTPHWGKSLRRSVDVVIDLVGGAEVERNAAQALKKGGRLVTLCGPDKYVGTTKRSAFGFTSWALRIAGRMFSPFKHYSYVLGDYNSAKREHWQALHDAKVWTPTVEMTVDFDNIKEVKRAIQHVRTHRAKGKVCIHVSDLDSEDLKQ